MLLSIEAVLNAAIAVCDAVNWIDSPSLEGSQEYRQIAVCEHNPAIYFPLSKNALQFWTRHKMAVQRTELHALTTTVCRLAADDRHSASSQLKTLIQSFVHTFAPFSHYSTYCAT